MENKIEDDKAVTNAYGYSDEELAYLRSKGITPEQWHEATTKVVAGYELNTVAHQLYEEAYDTLYRAHADLGFLKHNQRVLENAFEIYRRELEAKFQGGSNEQWKLLCNDVTMLRDLVKNFLDTGSENWNWKQRALYQETVNQQLQHKIQSLESKLNGQI